MKPLVRGLLLAAPALVLAANTSAAFDPLAAKDYKVVYEDYLTHATPAVKRTVWPYGMYVGHARVAGGVGYAGDCGCWGHGWGLWAEFCEEKKMTRGCGLGLGCRSCGPKCRPTPCARPACAPKCPPKCPPPACEPCDKCGENCCCRRHLLAWLRPVQWLRNLHAKCCELCGGDACCDPCCGGDPAGDAPAPDAKAVDAKTDDDGATADAAPKSLPAEPAPQLPVTEPAPLERPADSITPPERPLFDPAGLFRRGGGWSLPRLFPANWTLSPRAVTPPVQSTPR
jgi:hypothetical protein